MSMEIYIAKNGMANHNGEINKRIKMKNIKMVMKNMKMTMKNMNQ